jgi:hypothetical protein
MMGCALAPLVGCCGSFEAKFAAALLLGAGVSAGLSSVDVLGEVSRSPKLEKSFWEEEESGAMAGAPPAAMFPAEVLAAMFAPKASDPLPLGLAGVETGRGREATGAPLAEGEAVDSGPAAPSDDDVFAFEEAGSGSVGAGAANASNVVNVGSFSFRLRPGATLGDALLGDAMLGDVASGDAAPVIVAAPDWDVSSAVFAAAAFASTAPGSAASIAPGSRAKRADACAADALVAFGAPGFATELANGSGACGDATAGESNSGDPPAEEESASEAEPGKGLSEEAWPVVETADA